MKRLSPAMASALRNAGNGVPLNSGIHGQSAHGGFVGTEIALRKNGFINGSDEITDAGRIALAVSAHGKWQVALNLLGEVAAQETCEPEAGSLIARIDAFLATFQPAH